MVICDNFYLKLKRKITRLQSMILSTGLFMCIKINKYVIISYNSNGHENDYLPESWANYKKSWATHTASICLEHYSLWLHAQLLRIDFFFYSKTHFSSLLPYHLYKVVHFHRKQMINDLCRRLPKIVLNGKL